MKKIITILAICAILGGCQKLVNPSKGYIFRIVNKRFAYNPNINGKYEYFIRIDASEGDMTLYTDSNYDVGDTLQLIKISK